MKKPKMSFFSKGIVGDVRAWSVRELNNYVYFDTMASDDSHACLPRKDVIRLHKQLGAWLDATAKKKVVK